MGMFDNTLTTTQDYVVTYGRALLAVIVIGLIAWGLGVFSWEQNAVEGFETVRVIGFGCAGGDFHVVYKNIYQSTMRNVTVTYHTQGISPPGTCPQGCPWAAQSEYTDTLQSLCYFLDEPYEVNVSITWTADSGVPHRATGVLRGKKEFRIV